MLRNLVILGALLASAAAYTYYTDFQNEPPVTSQTEAVQEDAPTATPSMSAPSFSFIDIKGKMHALDDFKGKAVVLNFWASWCAPCVIEMPQMFDLATKTKNEAVYLFVSLDNSEEEINRFLQRHHKGTLPPNVYIGLDVDRKISKLFQTYKIPETYIIAPDLKITDKIIGADHIWNDNDMVEKIRGLSTPD